MINTHREPKRLKVEIGLANKIILSMGVELMYCLMILLLKSYPYHFVHTILSVPFCPLPFCPRTVLGLIDKDLQAFLLQTDSFVTHYNNSFKLCIAEGTFDTGRIPRLLPNKKH